MGLPKIPTSWKLPWNEDQVKSKNPEERLRFDRNLIKSLKGMWAELVNAINNYSLESHASSHENGGSDEIDVGGLSGELADEQDAGKIKGVSVDAPEAGDDGKHLFYDHGNSKFDYEDPLSGEAIKGWINFNGTGVIAIRDSYNVASIVDDGVGMYQINWDTDFTNTDYCVVATARCLFAVIGNFFAGVNTFAVGSTKIEVASHGGALIDVSIVTAMAIGDQ